MVSVLIIDPNHKHNSQMLDFFNTWKIPADVVVSSDEAIRMGDRPDTKKYDIIFIDQQIQNVGTEHTDIIIGKLSASNRHAELVIMTNNRSIHTIKKIHSSGIRWYLHKPVIQKELRNLIQRMFISDSGISSAIQQNSKILSGEKTSCKLNVLLAEDQVINQKIIIQLLGKKGWNVITAKNGLEAVQKARDTRFDLILMDVMMPEMNGFDATREIRKDTRGKNLSTPIIALTANAMKGDREKCLELGMNDYISKPIHLEDFYQTIEKHCSK